MPIPFDVEIGVGGICSKGDAGLYQGVHVAVKGNGEGDCLSPEVMDFRLRSKRGTLPLGKLK